MNKQTEAAFFVYTFKSLSRVFICLFRSLLASLPPSPPPPPAPSFDPTSLIASYIRTTFIFRDFLGAQWRGFTDLGSGLSGFSWRAGTTPGGSDVMPEHPLGLTFSAFTTDLPQLLPEGQTIFVTVSAVDAAGIRHYFYCLTFSQHVSSILAAVDITVLDALRI